MDRETLRKIKALPMRDFERVVNQVIDEDVERRTQSRVYQILTSMFLALYDRFPGLSAEALHSIAADTVEYANGIEPASELRQILLDKTGFDVWEKPSESKLRYIEKVVDADD